MVQGKKLTFIEKEDDIYSEYNLLIKGAAAGKNFIEHKLNDSILKRNYEDELHLKEVLNLEKMCTEINTEYLQLKNLNITKNREFNRMEIDNYELKSAQFEQLNVLEREKNQCSNNIGYMTQYFKVLDEINDIQKDNWESKRIVNESDIIRILRCNASGVYDHLKILCKPIDILYKKVFTLIFGNYLDAIVVDKKSTALKCIQVCWNE